MSPAPALTATRASPTFWAFSPATPVVITAAAIAINPNSVVTQLLPMWFILSDMKRLSIASALASLLLGAFSLYAQLPYPWFIYYDGAYRGTSKATFRKMLDIGEEEGIRTSTLSTLPDTCGGKILLRYVIDASTGTGGLPLYLCGADGLWRQLGYQADGTGYFVVHCDEPGVCLIGPNTAIIKAIVVDPL